MAGFIYSHSINGGEEIVKTLPIATATAISKGVFVLFTPGTGVVASTISDFDDPAIGVTVNDHPANSGDTVEVSVSPAAVFRHKSDNIITATGGSTSTFVVSGLLPQTDNLWNGGMLEIVTCAADPTLIGKKIPITASTGSTGTLTLPTQKAAFASGDTAKLCPGKLAIGEFGWDLDSSSNVDWDTSGGESLILVDADPETMTGFYMLRLHQFGNLFIDPATYL